MPDRQKPQPIFSVIEGGNKKQPKDAVLWECKVCDIDIGIATTTIIKVRRLPFINKGKVTGGLDTWVCAHCLGRGKTTPVQ